MSEQQTPSTDAKPEMVKIPITYPLHIKPANVVYAWSGEHSKIAPHYFEVRASNNPHGLAIENIQFQDGPLNGAHTDGVHNEDLLLMVRARLLAFQDSEFNCRENAIAITKIEEALNVLCLRTQERRQRGIEGTNQQ